MGGCSYDRDVYGSSSSYGWGSSGSSSGSSGYSSTASSVLSSHSLHGSMHPLKKTLKAKSKHPIIIMLDVTGSNTSFAKIVYDKMPMFYGQIEQKGYLKDFEIAVCAIGDAYTDDYPLQIASFSKGKKIDDWLAKLVLEGCGGGQRCETYELGMYYLLKKLQVEPEMEPIIFFLGDEAPYDEVSSRLIQGYVDSSYRESSDGVLSTKEVFKALHEKYPNIFVFLNPYQGVVKDEDIIRKWQGLFDADNQSHVILMQRDNEKAIVDLMLGVIAMIGENSLDSYKVDMLDRGQTQARLEAVTGMLENLSHSMVPVQEVSALQKTSNATVEKNKNKRL